ncbi:MAG: DUF1778 domain-containing protein [Thermomicrobiales bacterium]
MVAAEYSPEPNEDGKSTRVALRLTRQQADQLERAIALTGQSKTDFITQAIAERATVLFREQRVLELSERDMDALLQALENPGEMNDAMRRGMATFQRTQARG